MSESKKVMREILISLQKSSRTKILLVDIEKAFIKRFPSADEYDNAGGYEMFAGLIRELELDKLLFPLKSASINGRNPSLSSVWWLSSKANDKSWAEIDMLRVSNILSLQYYRNHTNYQTVVEWERIEKVYTFLKEKNEKFIIPRESRSYQIFGDEKFIGSEEGKAFLNRVKLTLSDLMTKNFGEPFVFTILPHASLEAAEDILVIENLSLFHTCIQYFKHMKIFAGLSPDVIVYGEGDKIESSFTFLYDMFPRKQYRIWYAGDIDAAGISIYCRLCEKFPVEDIQLAWPLYEAMVVLAGPLVPSRGQFRRYENFQRFVTELNQKGLPLVANVAESCWIEQKRLPQEVLNIKNMTDYHKKWGAKKCKS